MVYNDFKEKIIFFKKPSSVRRFLILLYFGGEKGS
jgi:hypothetical protein